MLFRSHSPAWARSQGGRTRDTGDGGGASLPIRFDAELLNHHVRAEEEDNLDNTRKPGKLRDPPAQPPNRPITIVVSLLLLNNSLYCLLPSPTLAYSPGPILLCSDLVGGGKYHSFRRKLWVLGPRVSLKSRSQAPLLIHHPILTLTLIISPPRVRPELGSTTISHHRPRYGLTLISLTTPPQTTFTTSSSCPHHLSRRKLPSTTCSLLARFSTGPANPRNRESLRRLTDNGRSSMRTN